MLALCLRLVMALLRLKVLTGFGWLLALGFVVVKISVLARQQLTFRAGHALAIARGRIKGRLRRYLRGHDDAIVVLGVLKIILAKHQIS